MLWWWFNSMSSFVLALVIVVGLTIGRRLKREERLEKERKRNKEEKGKWWKHTHTHIKVS